MSPKVHGNRRKGLMYGEGIPGVARAAEKRKKDFQITSFHGGPVSHMLQYGPLQKRQCKVWGVEGGLKQ